MYRLRSCVYEAVIAGYMMKVGPLAMSGGAVTGRRARWPRLSSALTAYTDHDDLSDTEARLDQ